MKNKECCENCYYFLHTSSRDRQTIGYCRANPPVPFYEKDENGELKPKIARYPVVLGDLWCGMWLTEDFDNTTEERVTHE